MAMRKVSFIPRGPVMRWLTRSSQPSTAELSIGAFRREPRKAGRRTTCKPAASRSQSGDSPPYLLRRILRFFLLVFTFAGSGFLLAGGGNQSRHPAERSLRDLDARRAQILATLEKQAGDAAQPASDHGRHGADCCGTRLGRFGSLTAQTVVSPLASRHVAAQRAFGPPLVTPEPSTATWPVLH